MNNSYKTGRCDVVTTSICNNNCEFCVFDDDQRKNFSSIPFNKIKSLLNDARKKTDFLVLTGGEFFVRGDFFKILDHASCLSFKEINIQTNARLLSYPEIASAVVKKGVTSFTISLHGKNSKQHDRITNVPNSFEQVIRAIKNLKKLQAKIITNTVICKYNQNDLVDIFNMLCNLKIDQIQFVFVRPVGKAFQNFDEVVPRVKDIKIPIRKCIDLSIEKNINFLVEGLPYCIMGHFPEKKAERNMVPVKIIGDIEHSPKQKKTKFEKCKDCIYNDACCGVWVQYASKYGGREFKPLKN